MTNVFVRLHCMQKANIPSPSLSTVSAVASITGGSLPPNSTSGGSVKLSKKKLQDLIKAIERTAFCKKKEPQTERIHRKF